MDEFPRIFDDGFWGDEADPMPDAGVLIVIDDPGWVDAEGNVELPAFGSLSIDVGAFVFPAPLASRTVVDGSTIALLAGLPLNLR